MDRQAALNRAREWLATAFTVIDPAHDRWHVERVCATALALAATENADVFIVELAAILHDAADHKSHGGDLEAGPKKAAELLREWNADESTVAAVSEIVRGVSFKGAGVPTPMATAEGRVVQDADRLDAIGAVGIARAFAFGGSRGRPLHIPGAENAPHDNWEAYRDAQGATTAHFYEKLLLLKDRLHTQSARRIAEGRHRFMEEFLSRFYREWDGKA